MKTIRTILFTLAATVLAYGLFALVSLKVEAALVERTLYQMFTKSYVIALIVGVAFLLIAIILTIALFAFKDEEGEETEEDSELEDEQADGFDGNGLFDASAVQERPIRAARPITPTPEEHIPSLFAEDDEDTQAVTEESPSAHGFDSFKAYKETQAEQEPITRAQPIFRPEAEAKYEPIFRSEPMIIREPVQRPEPVIVREPLLRPEPVIIREPVQRPEPMIIREPVSRSESADEPINESDFAAKEVSKVQNEPVQHCIYCGERVDKGSVFCPFCGKKR